METQIICDEASGFSSKIRMLNIFTQQHLHKIANYIAQCQEMYFYGVSFDKVSQIIESPIHIAVLTVIRLVLSKFFLIHVIK